MKIRLLIISLCVMNSVISLYAKSEKELFSSKSNKKHSINISVSDGITLGATSFWGIELAEALTGLKSSERNSSGVFAVGYRYSMNRFKVGGDFGFCLISRKVKSSDALEPLYKDKFWNFIILPTAEYVYFKRGWVELYGMASMGIDFTRQSQISISTTDWKLQKFKTTLNTYFAYQVNPIAIRVGSGCIAGFLEAGFGYRGLVTAGISLKF